MKIYFYQIQEGMLKVGSYSVCFAVLLSFAGCQESVTSGAADISEFVSLKRDFKQDRYAKQITDSIDFWVSERLAVSQSFLLGNKYKINDIIVFSRDSSLLFTTISEQVIYNSHVDWVYDLAGVKVAESWYFLVAGVFTPIHRELYKEGLYEPYTFEELSYIGYKHRLMSAMKKGGAGEFLSSDEWFEKRFFKDYSTRSDLDSVFLSFTSSKYYDRLDSLRIEEMKKENAAVKRSTPPEVELTLSEKIFGKKKKLFDSKAWKNRKK